MFYENKNNHVNLSVIEAVERLSSIAEMDFDYEVNGANPEQINLQNDRVIYKAVNWPVKAANSQFLVINNVKEMFKIILKHLRQYYELEQHNSRDEQMVEGIKNIMVIVGEAAKKLDKYTTIFTHTKEHHVTNLKEYRQLEEFYQRKIAKKIDEGVLGRWILALGLEPKNQVSKALPKKKEKMKFQTAHVFVDMESVKNDSDYELFFIRKEDGSRFFSPRLLRNIKLTCDFDRRLDEKKDPLAEVKLWQDGALNAAAEDILQSVSSLYKAFRHETCHIHDHELVDLLNKAVIALIMCHNKRNLLDHSPPKSCSEYFADFQLFLRQILASAEYQKILAYISDESDKTNKIILNLTHALCRAIFFNLWGFNSMIPITQRLIKDANNNQSKEHLEISEANRLIWSRLACDYAALSKLIRKGHPHGPLLQVIDILDEDSYHIFDPIIQQNIPAQLFEIELSKKSIAQVRFPAPIHQEFINKASIIDEFKDLFRDSKMDYHLLFNIQDRTSWKEEARCKALEEMGCSQQFCRKLSVVTLAVDTDFYFQEGGYEHLSHAENFIEKFKELLHDKSSGFFFPDFIYQELIKEDFFNHALHAIHLQFFSGKNVLMQESRISFIEIFYLFLMIRILNIANPKSFSLTCKDGIDIGPAYSGGLFVLQKILKGQSFTEHDWDELNHILYTPALLFRERVMLPDRFKRMLNAIKAVELAKSEIKAADLLALLGKA